MVLQAEALRTFILDQFTLLIINDAQSDEMCTAFSDASRSVGAESILTPSYLDHREPSKVVGRIVTWSMQEVALRRFNDSVVMLVEGDMFPVAPFSPLDFLSGYQIAGTQQGRRHASSGFLLRCVHTHAYGCCRHLNLLECAGLGEASQILVGRSAFGGLERLA